MAAPLSPPAPDRLLTEAERAVTLATANPGSAATLAAAVRDEARAARDHEALCVALRALGMVARDEGDLEAAIGHLRAAAAVGRRHGLRAREGEARTTLVFVLLSAGRTSAAMREADRAAPLLDRLDAARLGAQRALAQQRLGQAGAAEKGLREAIAAFRRLDSPLDEARAAGNLGIIAAYRGDLAGAEKLLRRALELFNQLGLHVPATDATHNLGWVAARQGDVPLALARYDEAQHRAAALGVERSAYLLDRCEALLAVRLTDEAFALAERAAAELAATGMQAERAEALLMAAQAALLSGDMAAARERAVEAKRAFARQQRAPWAALARYVELQARAAPHGGASGGAAGGGAAGGAGRPSPTTAWELAAELEAVGWTAPAAEARMTGAVLALRGQAAGAGGPRAYAELGAVSQLRSRGPVDVRVRGWHAEALLRRSTGDAAGALRAARAGVDLLAEHRAVLGATELRVHAAASAADLVDLGLALAVEKGSPGTVFSWAERGKAAAGQARRARPPRSGALAMALAELRRVTSECEAAAFAGAPTGPLVARQTRLEHEVRRLARHERGRREGAAGAPIPTPRDVGERLGSQRCLVELVEHGGTLHAVVVSGRGARQHPLGPARAAADELAHLGFALRQLARVSPAGDGNEAPAAREAAAMAEVAAAAAMAARQLDNLLLAPLAAELGDRDLVIVPTAELLNVPWSLLTACAGRAVAVAPSAAAWMAADGVHPGRGGRLVLLVAGPDLDHAEREVETLSAVHAGGAGPAVRCLTGPEASAAAVLGAADRAWLLHMAAHGEFRDDNPLFSSFWLADGPLNAYDLEGMRKVPAEVVLSACDSAVSGGPGGGRSHAVASLGVAALLLGLGARDVVASVVPVPDLEAVDLMADVHRGLARGEGMATSLAAAQQRVRAGDGGDGHGLLAAAAFVCFGAG